MSVDTCKCIVNTVIACSMYDVRIVAKNIAMYWYTGVSLQAKYWVIEKLLLGPGKLLLKVINNSLS